MICLVPGPGHLPAEGPHSGGITRKALPGVLIAALAGLPLDGVLGPEAPLIAMGGALALLFASLARAPETEASTAARRGRAAAAAISALFGNPIVGAVRCMADVLWVPVPAPPSRSSSAGVFVGGRFAARFVATRTAGNTTLCALGAAICITLCALVTGRSPAEAALSGESAPSGLAQDPHAWPVGALIAVRVFKGLAYALCLGSLRGGPVFPALFLGGAAGVVLAPLPGLGLVPAMAAGMAASVTAALQLPVSSVVPVVLLLGNVDTVALVVLAAVAPFVLVQRLPQGPSLPAIGERPLERAAH
ncbi:chloride channel protein [Streptomyces sp. NPDC001617]